MKPLTIRVTAHYPRGVTRSHFKTLDDLGPMPSIVRRDTLEHELCALLESIDPGRGATLTAIRAEVSDAAIEVHFTTAVSMSDVTTAANAILVLGQGDAS